MTQKELLYVEDAINHEKALTNELEITEKELQDKNLKEFINKEKKKHQKMEKALEKILEEKQYE